jgi:subtilisin family serine protease
VANMSVGAEYDPALDAAVAESIASGVTYVVAAGNEDDDARYYSPARVPAAITVGATNSKDQRAYFSNYGSYVDLFAPGLGVKSAYKGSDTATAILSGTSMATPHVAGAAAIVLDKFPRLTPKQVRDYLVQRSTTGKIVDRGPRSPDRLLYLPPPA